MYVCAELVVTSYWARPEDESWQWGRGRLICTCCVGSPLWAQLAPVKSIACCTFSADDDDAVAAYLCCG